MWRVIARLKQIVGAWSILTILSWLYDDILYPLVVGLLGPYIGGPIMAMGSAAICFGMIVWYTKSGVDWLGVEETDTAIGKTSTWIAKVDNFCLKDRHFALAEFALLLVWVALWLPTRVILGASNLLRMNDATMFVLLNIIADPFVATAFLRHGRSGGLTKNDWVIFWGSVVFSNLYWTIRSHCLVQILKYLWQFLAQ